jgi:phosphatidylserine/phosphatidylglycerophosphate/cardiolipin synthase-like enzyme
MRKLNALVLVGLVILLGLSIWAAQRVMFWLKLTGTMPQDAQVQVYMNHNEQQEYTEPYRQIRRRGDNLEQMIVDAILSAQRSIDVAVQELRLPKIAQALIDQQHQGVVVRVILENTYSRPYSSFNPAEIAQMPTRERNRLQEAIKLIDLDQDGRMNPAEIGQRDALVMLQNANVPLIDDTADGSAGSNLMHHKFVIIDNERLIITSANFTTSDIHGDFGSSNSRGNANNLLNIQSAVLAAQFTQEFNLMWGDGPGGALDSLFGTRKPHRSPQTVSVGAGTITVKFSPDSASIPWTESTNGLIGKTIAKADQGVELALFVFSDQQIANTLEAKHQANVEIRALIDPEFAYNYYSEALDMLGVSLQPTTQKQPECHVETENRPWQAPISAVGVPRLPPGDKLHHKFGIVDGQTVITGSHNWSAAANFGNDETLVVIHNSRVADYYGAEFHRLYQGAFLGLPPAIKRRAEQYQQRCPRQVQTPSVFTRRQVTVNLNTASLAEIEALPNVGPKLAQRIVEARQVKPITSLHDLDQVPGVGPKLLETLSDHITW